jgi:hypothetical protein
MHYAVEALESGGAGDRERAAGVCAVEQRLADARHFPVVPRPCDGVKILGTSV